MSDKLKKVNFSSYCALGSKATKNIAQKIVTVKLFPVIRYWGTNPLKKLFRGLKSEARSSEAKKHTPI